AEKAQYREDLVAEEGVEAGIGDEHWCQESTRVGRSHPDLEPREVVGHRPIDRSVVAIAGAEFSRAELDLRGRREHRENRASQYEAEPERRNAWRAPIVRNRIVRSPERV